MREQLSYDIAHGNLTHNPREETACDRIGALARADRLGALLWRITGNMDPKAFIEAQSMLSAMIQAPLRVCNKAMQEWLVTLCGTCNGRTFVTDEAGVRTTCHECGGSGRGRHSDAERMHALGVSRAEYLTLAHLFDAAHATLSAADAKVGGQVARQLGRKAPKSMYRKGTK